MLTHRSLSTSVAQQVDGDNPNIGFTADDVILCSLPMFHIYSLNTIMMCGLRVGAAIVVMRRFDLAKMMELVEKHRITIAPLVPPVVVAVAKSDKVAKHDLSSVRMVMSGAAPMGKDIEDAFMAKIPGAVLGQVRVTPFFSLLDHEQTWFFFSCCINYFPHFHRSSDWTFGSRGNVVVVRCGRLPTHKLLVKAT